MFDDEFLKDGNEWRSVWDTNRLHVMGRDPTSLFAYWEVSNVRKQLICAHFQCEWTKLPFYLRIHDVTDIVFDGQNAHFTRTIAVQPTSTHWYIHAVDPGRKYLAQLCTTTFEQHFFVLLHSNVIETPRLAKASSEPQIRFRSTKQQQPTFESESRKRTVSPRTPYPAEFDGYSVVSGKRGVK